MYLSRFARLFFPLFLVDEKVILTSLLYFPFFNGSFIFLSKILFEPRKRGKDFVKSRKRCAGNTKYLVSLFLLIFVVVFYIKLRKYHFSRSLEGVEEKRFSFLMYSFLTRQT